LHEQHNRGTDGAGYILVPHWSPETPIVKRFLSPFHALTQLQKDIDMHCDMDGQASIAFHHRFPTSTANVEQCAHPIQSGKSFLIHNGIISNSWTLKAAHEKRGIIYATKHKDKFNDSESLAHEWTLALAKPKKKKKGNRYHIKAYGSFAFVRYDIERQAFMYGRNSGNPLQHVILDDGTLCFVSQSDYALAESKQWTSVEAGTLHILKVPSLEHEAHRFTHASPPPVVHTPYNHGGKGYSSYGGGKPYATDNWEDWEEWKDWETRTVTAQHNDATQSMFKPKETEIYIPAKYRVQSAHSEPHNGWLHIPKK
jgi:glucosamine 6-phosphate synthetase-like amidotransferase/phosphosugar isomerase protein